MQAAFVSLSALPRAGWPSRRRGRTRQSLTLQSFVCLLFRAPESFDCLHFRRKSFFSASLSSGTLPPGLRDTAQHGTHVSRYEGKEEEEEESHPDGRQPLSPSHPKPVVPVPGHCLCLVPRPLDTTQSPHQPIASFKPLDFAVDNRRPVPPTARSSITTSNPPLVPSPAQATRTPQGQHAEDSRQLAQKFGMQAATHLTTAHSRCTLSSGEGARADVSSQNCRLPREHTAR